MNRPVRTDWAGSNPLPQAQGGSKGGSSRCEPPGQCVKRCLQSWISRVHNPEESGEKRIRCACEGKGTFRNERCRFGPASSHRLSANYQRPRLRAIERTDNESASRRSCFLPAGSRSNILRLPRCFLTKPWDAKCSFDLCFAYHVSKEWSSLPRRCELWDVTGHTPIMRLKFQ